MHSSTRRFTMMGLYILMGSMLLSACATKKFVREQVATLDPKITAVSNAVKENAERIDAVNTRATQGITAADAKATAAGTAAATADAKAVAAQTAATTADGKAVAAQTSATTANTAVATANTRIGTVETGLVTRINAVDNYTQSGQISSVMFDNDKDALTDEAKKTLDGVAGQVSNLKSGYLLELQGFTDSRGDERYNIMLSQRRAENVQRYLVGKGVMLSRVAIVGQGEDKPIGDNKVKDGRAQNRRVEIRVLKSPISS